MIARSLRLRGFRNYAVQDIELERGLSVFIGENGQGKTNLLEALCVLATTKSPLVERDRELIRWGDKEARISAEVEIEAGRGTERRVLEYSWRIEGNSIVRELRAGGVLQNTAKGGAAGGAVISAVAQWLGQLQVVAFFPHDLTIITGGPEERRHFLNLELGKTKPAYFSDYARYRRALKQRNALLRSMADKRRGAQTSRWRPPAETGAAPENLGTLSEWNRQLVTYGARVLEQRARFTAELRPLLADTHRALRGGDELLEMGYIPGIRMPGVLPPGEVNWGALLAASLEADHAVDLRRCGTQSGPHRDELVFKQDGTDLRRYGSQGQQRLAVLALKIALGRWVEQTLGTPPVLLLDDALSELDAARRANLLGQAAGFAQSVLTVTDASFVQLEEAKYFTVKAGMVVTGNG